MHDKKSQWSKRTKRIYRKDGLLFDQFSPKNKQKQTDRDPLFQDTRGFWGHRPIPSDDQFEQEPCPTPESGTGAAAPLRCGRGAGGKQPIIPTFVRTWRMADHDHSNRRTSTWASSMCRNPRVLSERLDYTRAISRPDGRNRLWGRGESERIGHHPFTRVFEGHPISNGSRSLKSRR